MTKKLEILTQRIKNIDSRDFALKKKSYIARATLDRRNYNRIKNLRRKNSSERLMLNCIGQYLPGSEY